MVSMACSPGRLTLMCLRTYLKRGEAGRNGGRPPMFLAGWVHLGDPGVPVGQRGAGSTTAGACRDVRRKVACLADVLRGHPDVGSIDHGCPVVAPARSRRVGGVEDRRPTEAVGR